MSSFKAFRITNTAGKISAAIVDAALDELTLPDEDGVAGKVTVLTVMLRMPAGLPLPPLAFQSSSTLVTASAVPLLDVLKLFLGV